MFQLFSPLDVEQERKVEREKKIIQQMVEKLGKNVPKLSSRHQLDIFPH